MAKREVIRYMREVVDEHVDPQTGEVNLTALAEDAAHQADHDEWLDDPDHPVWDWAVEVADEVEGYKKNAFSAARVAEELAETWHNGNRKDAVAALDKLTKKRALAVAVYLYQYLQDSDQTSNYDQNVLTRMLSDRV